MKTLFLSILLILFLASCSQASNQKAESDQKITGLKLPESVVQAKDGKIYVSEIAEFGKNGDGQISVIQAGKASVFATGLDDPKGLVIMGDYLYVADKTQIIKINLNDAAQKSVFVAADAFPKTPLFLNDLEADADGNLYVSDSGDIMETGKGGVIYKVDVAGQVKKLIDGEMNENVMAPNGLLMDENNKNLIWVDFTSGVLYRMNTESAELTEITQGFNGGDGIVHGVDGVLYVSNWKSGKVFSVSQKGEVTLLKEGYQSAADIAKTNDGAFLMVPDMKAGVLDFIHLTK